MKEKFEKTAQFFSTNIVFINELYQKFVQNPSSIDSSWAEFFVANEEEVKSVLIDYQGPDWSNRDLTIIDAKQYDISSNGEIDNKSKKNNNINIDKSLINDLLLLKLQKLHQSYKKHAHFTANLDPLNIQPKKQIAEISINYHNIKREDLELEIDFNDYLNFNKAKVKDFILHLNNLYCSNIGCEYDYISNEEEKSWLDEQYNQEIINEIAKEEKLKILNELVKTEKFEQFLHKRFPGAKRFSIEGSESSINAIEKIIDFGAKNGIQKICIGMAHRGRLNTLTNVMGKKYSDMIAEFQGAVSMPENITKSGDVKYHMGYSSSRNIDGNKIDLSLAFNPSHLEAVNCVVAGKVRAKQDLINNNKQAICAVLLHGDAAFIGQGSVAESLVTGTVEAYNIGGVIHIITNNQIGFTANSWDSRGTHYASDLAKMIEAPIFHVNGDDVESVVKIAKLAVKYRQKFQKDIIIDIIGYRKYGHNEGDEPLYTQPVMYKKVKSQKSCLEKFASKIINQNIINNDNYTQIISDFEANLAKNFDEAKNYKAKADWLKGLWSKIEHNPKEQIVTKISKKTILDLITKLTTIPQNFNINNKILKQLKARNESVISGTNIDWGCAESLAFASLINEGSNVRISGQDSGRGTFSHRHSIIHDSENADKHNIYSQISNKAKFEVYDSILSEYGVLGFEYGYSLANPNSLTIWEAQFGDFANGAQIIFDQFIASSEVKWLRKSGLVMLLPHGYEGQGPEHSSARLERYLQSCADNNLRVVNITNPANFFHALRRQIISKDRKPLIVMTPKSLLRHKLAVSDISEFCDDNFKAIIPETDKLTADNKVKKVILCSGKIYYDIYEARNANKINDIALIRFEQLYPYPEAEIAKELAKYKNAEIFWCQEEPKNMGSWQFIEQYIENTLITNKSKFLRPKYIGRISCASPATGYASCHKKEQDEIINQCLK